MAYRTTPKMARRKDEHRRKFVDSAIRLFGRQGYHATTVPKIVAKSGSSTGSFYFYFRNKEDVFAAALESLGERVAAALNEEIAKVWENPLLQMKAAVEALMLFLAENPDEARILIVESSGLTPQLEAVRRKIVSSHARGVQNALSQLSRRLPDMDAAVVARCWVGAVYEAVYHWLETPAAERMPATRLARAVAEFNLRGIGAPKEAL